MATSAFRSTSRRLSVAAAGGGAAADDSFNSSSNGKAQHRRSRSLSRFSRPLPSELEEETPPGYKAAPKGKFVNTVRGSDFPEISLDDLALDFFSSQENDSTDDRSSKNGKTGNDEEINRGERGRSRSAKRASEIGRWASETASSIRRGRSVSRHLREPSVEDKKVVSQGSGGKVVNSEANSRRRRSVSVSRHLREPAVEDKKVVLHGSGGKVVNSEANLRRRRSLSVSRYGRSDFESGKNNFQSSHSQYDLKNANTWNGQVQKTSASADRRLQKSLSQKELSLLHDGYSSQSSALTDDDSKDSRFGKSRDERTIRTVYSQKAQNPDEGITRGGLYEVMRKELRYAVDEIRTELEQVMVRTDDTTRSDISSVLDRTESFRNFSAIRKNYATKLEQSEKCKQDLLAEMLLEDQRGRELSKIVKEILPDTRNSSEVQKTSQARKRSTDRNRITKRLTDEAERYFEDFISNVEDTDISSIDGERSDGSSTLGGSIKAKVSTRGVTESFQSPAGSNPQTVEMDGVILPWLQWETSNDGSLKDKNKVHTPMTPKTLQWKAEQENSQEGDPSKYSISSHGSSNSGLLSEVGKGENGGSRIRQRSSFDMSDYLVLCRSEEVLFERYKERLQIHSGGLLLCNSILHL